VHNRSHGWVTPRDHTELLLAAREQPLQPRATEVCKREAALDEVRRVHGSASSPELGAERPYGGAASVVAITA